MTRAAMPTEPPRGRRPALALLVLACACEQKFPDPPPPPTVEEVCGEGLGDGDLCANPVCADWPPCQIPTVVLQDDWPRFLLGPAPQGSIAAVWSVRQGPETPEFLALLGPDWHFSVVELPPEPWAQGAQDLLDESATLRFPYSNNPRASPMAWARVSLFSDCDCDVAMGRGFWALEAPDWGAPDGAQLLAWAGEDLAAGPDAAPSLVVPVMSDAPAGAVGDLDQGGRSEVVLSSGGVLGLFPGEDLDAIAAGTAQAILDPDGRNSDVRFQALGPLDVNGDGVGDLVLGRTERLANPTGGNFEDEPVEVDVFYGGEPIEGVLTHEDADLRIRPLSMVHWLCDLDGQPDGNVDRTDNPQSLLWVHTGNADGDAVPDVYVVAGNDPLEDPRYPDCHFFGQTPAARVFKNPSLEPGRLWVGEDAVELRVFSETIGVGDILVSDLDGDGLDEVVLPMASGVRWTDWEDLGRSRRSVAVWSGTRIAGAEGGTILTPDLFLASRRESVNEYGHVVHDGARLGARSEDWLIFTSSIVDTGNQISAVPIAALLPLLGAAE